MKFTRGSAGSGDKNNSSKKNTVNKKGVILTSILVAGIIAASFIVWLLPGGNTDSPITSNMTVTFLDPNMTLASVKSQFGVLKDEVQNQVNAQRMNQTQNNNIGINNLSKSNNSNIGWLAKVMACGLQIAKFCLQLKGLFRG